MDKEKKIKYQLDRKKKGNKTLQYIKKHVSNAIRGIYYQY